MIQVPQLSTMSLFEPEPDRADAFLAAAYSATSHTVPFSSRQAVL